MRTFFRLWWRGRRLLGSQLTDGLFFGIAVEALDVAFHEGTENGVRFGDLLSFRHGASGGFQIRIENFPET